MTDTAARAVPLDRAALAAPPTTTTTTTTTARGASMDTTTAVLDYRTSPPTVAALTPDPTAARAYIEQTYAATRPQRPYLHAVNARLAPARQLLARPAPTAAAAAASNETHTDKFTSALEAITEEMNR